MSSNPFKKSREDNNTPVINTPSFNKFFNNNDDEYKEIERIKAQEAGTIASFSSHRNKTDLEIEQSIKEFSKKYIGGGINRQRFITYDILKNAPEGYFKNYVKNSIHYASLIRAELAESEMSDLIAKAQAEPTNDVVQEQAFGTVNAIAVDLIEKFRGLERQILLSFITNEVLGLSVLDPLWREKSIDEIICNGIDDIQVEIRGQLYKVPSVQFDSVDHMESLLSRLYEAIGKVYSQSTPLIKGRLHDNSRIFAVHPVIAPDGPNFNIRKHPESFWTPKDIVEKGSASEELMTFLGNLIYKGSSFLVLGGTSTGKALTLNTKIVTPQGFTTMQNIKPGDKVKDRFGNNVTVTNKFYQPPREVYEIKFENDTTVLCDLEHNWVVKHSRIDKTTQKSHLTEDYEVKTTKELLNLIEKNHLFVPVNRAVEYNLTNTINLSPYILGVLINSSLQSQNNNIIFNINEKIAEKCNNLFYEQRKMENLLTPIQNKENEWLLNSSYLIKDLRELDLIKEDNTGNIEINFIPEKYLTSSIEDRELLLSGILDSSDVISTDKGVVVNVKKELVSNISRLSSSLGYKVIYESKSNVNHDPSNSKITSLLIDKNNCDELLQIMSIKPLNKMEEMACITVDGPDSTYLITDSFITTHNTSMLNALTGFYKEDVRIVTLEDNLEMKPNPNKLLAAAMETRPARPDKPHDTGVTMRDLVKASTQMRPDTIIIGEVTDGAALDLVNALNTGHNGASTLHANSEFDGVYRLSSLMGQTGEVVGDGALPLIAAAFDFIIYLEHFPQDGSRRIVSISEVASRPSKDKQGNLELPLYPLWKFNAKGINKSGKIVGEYVQVGDISEERKRRKHLDLTKPLSWEELKKISSI